MVDTLLHGACLFLQITFLFIAQIYVLTSDLNINGKHNAVWYMLTHFVALIEKPMHPLEMVVWPLAT